MARPSPTLRAPGPPTGGNGAGARPVATRPRWEAPAALALFVLAVVLVFPDVALGGRTLSTAPIALGVTGEPPHVGYPEPLNGAYPFLKDPLASATIFDPATQLVNRLRAEGGSVTWDPTVALGQPLLATAEPALVSPLRAPLWLSGSLWVQDVFLLGRLLLAAVGVWLLARRMGLAPLAAIGAGLAYELIGYHHLHVNSVHVDFAALLPFVLLAVEGALRRPRALHVLLLALVTAAAVLADNPQPAVLMLLFAGGWALVRAIGTRRTWGLVAVVLGLTLGCALTAFTLVPFLELSGAALYPGLAVHTHEAGSGDGLLTLPWRTLASVFFPYIYGPPTLPFDEALSIDLANYTGALVPFLALFGLGAARRRPGPILYLGAVVVLGLAKMFDGPGLDLLGRLPVLSVLRFVLYLPPILNLSLVLLAAVGLDRILARLVSVPEVLLVGAGFAGGLAGLLALTRPLTLIVPREALVLVIAVPVVCCGLAMAALLLVRMEAVPSEVVAGVLILLVVVEAAALAAPARGVPPVAAVLLPPRAPATVFGPRPLRVEPWVAPAALDPVLAESATARVVGRGVALFPNSGQALGLADVRGQTTLSIERPLLLARTFLDPDAQQRFAGYEFSPFAGPGDEEKEALLDLLGVGWFVSGADLPADEAAADPGAVPVAADEHLQVHRNSDALPRAFSVTRALPAADAQAALAAMPEVLDDPAGTAVVEGLDAGELAALDGSAETATVTVERYDGAEAELTVDGPATSLVVLSDTWYPGWNATVSGQPAQVHPVDVALRGVVVPPGRHAVTLRFASTAVRLGVTVTLVAAGLLLLGVLAEAVAGRVRRNRQRTQRARRAPPPPGVTEEGPRRRRAAGSRGSQG